MNNRVNYSVVGGVVLVLLGGLIAFVFWMLKPVDENVMKPYKIFFTESVSGLNIDAPVKYRGVTVGKVEQMRINPNNSEEIEITVSLRATTPIKTNTVAKLTSQGITGLSYIDLSQGSQNAPLLKPKEGEEYPVITSVPSFFERFEKSMSTVSSRLSKTLLQTETLLNEENQGEIARILKHSAGTMENVDKVLDEKTIAHLQSFIANADSISGKFDAMMPKIDGLIDNTLVWEESIKTSFASISNSYKGIEGSMIRFKQSMEEGDLNIKEIAGGSLANIDYTMTEMQTVLIRLEQLIEQMGRSPSDVIFKSEEIRKGPGE